MKIKYWLFITTVGLGCKDKYMPKLNLADTRYLVVEGFINAAGPTSISLTRTVKLDSIQIVPETGAQVEVRDESGSSLLLTETSPGRYSADTLSINPSLKYSLSIKTNNGSTYLSDLEEVKITPPIDSIGWKAGTDDLAVNVSTHDVNNKTIYYQWEFEETWQYNTLLQSPYIRNTPGNIVPRSAAQSFPSFCWKSDISTDIIITSSAKLNQDLIYEYPLTRISYSSTNKLMTRYSILVKQYAMTKEGYEWKEKIKKNTERLGTIFDALPSEVSGNIHCISNPAEMVIGFIGCNTVTQKRQFINRGDLPKVFVRTGYEECTDNPIPWYTIFSDSLLGSPSNSITKLIRNSSTGEIIQVYISTPDCTDCRVRGGVGVKPDFW